MLITPEQAKKLGPDAMCAMALCKVLGIDRNKPLIPKWDGVTIIQGDCNGEDKSSKGN